MPGQIPTLANGVIEVGCYYDGYELQIFRLEI